MPSGPDEDQKRVQEATRTLALPRHQRERFKPGRPSSERARPALGSRCVNPRVARLSWDPVALLAHVIWGGDYVLPSPRQKTSHGEPDLPRGLLARSKKKRARASESSAFNLGLDREHAARGIFRQLYLPKFLSKGTKKTRRLFLSYCDIATQSKAIGFGLSWTPGSLFDVIRSAPSSKYRRQNVRAAGEEEIFSLLVFSFLSLPFRSTPRATTRRLCSACAEEMTELTPKCLRGCQT